MIAVAPRWRQTSEPRLQLEVPQRCRQQLRFALLGEILDLDDQEMWSLGLIGLQGQGVTPARMHPRAPLPTWLSGRLT